jgi:ABC-type transport system substrate-binding protein
VTVPAAATPSGVFASDATLAFGLAGEPVNWNPAARGARAGTDPALATVADAVLPSASLAGRDGTLRPNQAVVSSVVEIGADLQTATPQTVTYEIDPRSVWSDGVAITGADFVYTWEAQSGLARFKDRDGRPFTPASTAGYSQIASVTSPPGDADRVVVRFATPDADWASLFDPILPAHIARSVGFDTGFSDPVTSLVSGGPFLVQSYQPGADVVLVRNPRWWGPAANLSTLDIVFVDSPAVAAVSLEQGQLDAAVAAFTPGTVAALRATAGLTVSVTNGPVFDDLVFNQRSGPLAVRAVRLAIMVALDRRSVARAAAASGDTAAAPVQNRAFVPGTAGYRDDAGVLGEAGPAAQLQRGASLLSAAGYVRHGATLVHLGRAVGLTLTVDTASPLASVEVAAHPRSRRPDRDLRRGVGHQRVRLCEPGDGPAPRTVGRRPLDGRAQRDRGRCRRLGVERRSRPAAPRSAERPRLPEPLRPAARRAHHVGGGFRPGPVGDPGHVVSTGWLIRPLSRRSSTRRRGDPCRTSTSATSPTTAPSTTAR